MAFFRIDDDEVQRALRRLDRFGTPRMAANALNKTAFEIREAEADHVGRVFEFSGPSTRKFLASPRSFVFEAARPSRLKVAVFMRPRAERVLADHVEGGDIRADERRLSFHSKLAIPVDARRGARGRVRRAQHPRRVTSAGGGGFVTPDGRAIIQRQKRGRQGKVLFVLTPRAQLDRRFRFGDVLLRTAQREFPRKVRREFERLR